MSVADILSFINDLADRPNYVAYDFEKVQLMFGVPPAPIKGLSYIFADYYQQQSKLVMSLNGKGVFVANKNKSGIIEFGLLDGVVSNGVVQVTDMTGIPIPIAITDGTTTGTSTIIGTACRLIKTPAWRKERLPGVNIYTFSTPVLLISHGVRSAE